MKFKVKIIKDNVEVREKSNDVSSVVITVDMSDTLVTATRYIKGWYYIDEFVGWVRVKDVIVKEKIEDYTDADLSDNTSDDGTNPGSDTEYDIEKIIKEINDGDFYIKSDKIICIDDDTQIVLDILMKSLNNTLNDMSNIVTKVTNTPNIPMPDISNYAGQSLVIEEDPNDKTKFICKFNNIDYSNITNKPSIVTATEW